MTKVMTKVSLFFGYEDYVQRMFKNRLVSESR